MLDNLPANGPPAAWSVPQCPVLPPHSVPTPSQGDGRAGAVAFPSDVSSVWADGARFTSGVSGREVGWAAAARKSRGGLEKAVAKLGWAAWSCSVGTPAMGWRCRAPL